MKVIYKFPGVLPITEDSFIVFSTNYGYLVNLQNGKGNEIEIMFVDSDIC